LGGLVAGGNSSGQLAVQLQALGSRSNPEIEGEISISNAAFSSDALPIGIESTNGEITVHGKHLEVKSLTGVAGGGQLSATGGADFGTTPTYGFLLKTTSMRVRQNGIRAILDADLSLAGSFEQSTLGGRVTVHKLSFNEGSDLSDIVEALSGDETVS